MTNYTPTLTPVQVAERCRKIVDEIGGTYLEKRPLAEFMMITMLAKFHALIVGPPGTAKSDMCRVMANRLVGASFFEVLLTKSMGAEHVMGPYDLPGLRDRGDLRRKIQGYLPTADIVLLDELDKMGKSLSPALLSSLNERLYHETNGGRSTKKIPLHTAFGAANEPLHGEEGQSALNDRLPMQFLVDYVQENSNWIKVIRSGVGHSLQESLGDMGTPTTLQWEEFVYVTEHVIPNIPLAPSLDDAYITLRRELKAKGIVVSDRRWRQTARALQAHAFLRGADEATEADVTVLRYMLWQAPEHIPFVERLTLSVSNPVAEKVLEIVDAGTELMQSIIERRGQSSESLAQHGTDVSRKLRTLNDSLSELRQESTTKGHGLESIDEAQAHLDKVMRTVYIDCLGMAADAVDAQMATRRNRGA